MTTPQRLHLLDDPELIHQSGQPQKPICWPIIVTSAVANRRWQLQPQQGYLMDMLSPAKKRNFGQLQEQIAAEFLIANGLELLFTNFHCRLGEIDLIMLDDDTLVFVEVRYRRSDKFGSAVESVGHRKQTRLLRCAQYFLISHNLSDKLPCRFDILGLSPGQNYKEASLPSATVGPQIEWLKNAFGS